MIDKRISNIFYREFQLHPASVTDPALALEYAREAASNAMPYGMHGTFDDEALTFTICEDDYED